LLNFSRKQSTKVVAPRQQILEHAKVSLDWTPHDCKWIPHSARLVSVGATARNTGMLAIYNLTGGKAELAWKNEQPSALRASTFGASTSRALAVVNFAGHLQVFGRNAVADGTGLFHAAGVDQRATVAQALGDDRRTRHLGQQAVNLALHGVDIRGIRAQQNALCQFVVLGALAWMVAAGAAEGEAGHCNYLETEFFGAITTSSFRFG
jgi:hypothetical protein